MIRNVNSTLFLSRVRIFTILQYVIHPFKSVIFHWQYFESLTASKA